MSTGLLLTGFVMGLAGGPHCLAMCGTACAALGRSGSREAIIAIQPANSVRSAGSTRPKVFNWPSTISFQVGRLIGYSASGGLVAWLVDNLAMLSAVSTAFRPVWVLMHAAMLAWGIMLVVLARQPAWLDGMGQSIWRRVQATVGAHRTPLVLGLVWTLLPCGLLYSALLVASLSGGPLYGALCMALFAAGSAVSLTIGPWAWELLQHNQDQRRQAWGVRLAGTVLAVAAGWALVHDLDPRVTDYCRSLLPGWLG